jgi:hypothetical protein
MGNIRSKKHQDEPERYVSAMDDSSAGYETNQFQHSNVDRGFNPYDANKNTSEFSNKKFIDNANNTSSTSNTE